jgi:hypothetical protein
MSQPGVETTLEVNWYCGYYVGSPKWQRGADWVYEPDECATEFITFETLADWQEGYCDAECPRCKGDLTQAESEPSLADYRSEDGVRCLRCGLWQGNLVLFHDVNDWTCPNCGLRFGITVF